MYRPRGDELFRIRKESLKPHYPKLISGFRTLDRKIVLLELVNFTCSGQFGNINAMKISFRRYVLRDAKILRVVG